MGWPFDVALLILMVLAIIAAAAFVVMVWIDTAKEIAAARDRRQARAEREGSDG